jgi:trigger factor
MQVSVENTSSIGRRLTVNIPAMQVQSEINHRMNEVLKSKKIDGFRPGKVPKHLIQQKYGAQIRHDAISNIIESGLPTILQQESLEPAGRPEIERVMNLNEEGKDLTYVVSFEIFPEIILSDFSNIEVEKYIVEIKEDDLDKAIDGLRNQLATWVPVERKAKIGDRLTVDYTSTLNGKPYENSSNQDVIVELGSNAFIQGFEQGLENAAAGETCELDLRFPEEWRMEKLAGKPVHFLIHVKSVTEKELAALDDQFAKKIGAEDTAEIRNKVRENLQKQIKHMADEITKKQALDKLLAQSDIPIPKALIDNEMASLHEDLHRNMGDKAHESCQHQGLDDEAKRRVTLSLILRKIVKLEELTPDEQKVREKIAEISKSFGNAEFIENMYYESEELISRIRNTVLVEQAIDLILAKASIIEKSITVDELFKREA